MNDLRLLLGYQSEVSNSDAVNRETQGAFGMVYVVSFISGGVDSKSPAL